MHLLLGEEPGEITEYREWLQEYGRAPRNEKSSLSGNPVPFSVEDYCKDAKFIGFDEIDFSKHFEPLGINEIKDVDSIIEALQERVYYAGGLTLGNSRFVGGSSNIHNSSHVLESQNIVDSNNIAYTNMARASESLFGCDAAGEGKHTIRGLELWKTSRCFDVFEVRMVSDCYYSVNLESCQNCFFSFNLKAKNYCIGNLELGRDAYLKRKGALLEEIRDSLSKKKKVAGILDILLAAKDRSCELKEKFEEVSGKAEYRKEFTDVSGVDKAFSSTTQLLLGEPLGPVKAYEGWLSKHVLMPEFHNSAISGRRAAITNYSKFGRFPRSRLAALEEYPLLSSLKLSEGEANSISISSAPEHIGKIAYASADADIQNAHMVDCCMMGLSSNCYKCSCAPEVKNSACSFWPKGTENAFGCHTVHDSSFVINGYSSSKISRAFEVDLCRDCSDIYFSHNCEALQDAMFCFNAKNLRKAIGNAQYSIDEYKRIKSSLLEQISDELDKNKELRWDIYSIGCVKVKP